MMKLRLIVPLLVLVFGLAACENPPHLDQKSWQPSSTQIGGTILMPASQVAAASRPTGVTWALGLVIPASYADVIGLTPVANTPVELVRVDGYGNVLSVIQSTTTDSSGNYTFTAAIQPDSTLMVRLPNEPVNVRAIVTSSLVDVTPVSEAVIRSVLAEITASGANLYDFTVDEIAALVEMTDGLSIDVTAAPTFDDAVNTVLAQSGTLLTDLVTGYAGTSMVASLNNTTYALTGSTTTLVPPPQVNGSNAGIDHRSIDGGMGFVSSYSRTAAKGQEFSLSILSDMVTAASYFCDADGVGGTSFVPAANGQVVVTSPTGNGAAVGSLTSDGRMMVYPVDTAIAGVDGNIAGLGRGVRVAMRVDNEQPLQGISLNPSVDGNYNMISYAAYMDPAGGTMGGGGMGGGGMGMGGGGGAGTYVISNAAATLTFSGASTLDNNGWSELASTGGAYSSLISDFSNAAVTSGTGTNSYAGVFKVMPGNGIVAPLGTTSLMMGNMGGNNVGSGDVMQGKLIETPSGQVAQIGAFSTWLTGGMMGGGGGMGMGASGCDGGSSGQMGGGGMGGGAGEGRGLVVMAQQSAGLTTAAISGTYNVVADISSFTEITSSIRIDEDIHYGTFTFDGAGNITAGDLHYNRASMDVAAALGGSAGSVTSATGSASYTGTYTVSGTDGTVTLALSGLGTAGGFVSPDGSFVAVRVEETGTTAGKRGLLLMTRQ